jgi:hypothetical protein
VKKHIFAEFQEFADLLVKGFRQVAQNGGFPESSLDEFLALALREPHTFALYHT